ncbi:MAG: polymer-forming cytoskeletal protein [Anaerolineales bacterium]|uniref:polymer-forming cytoskeletal protein n=1 Tax=Candidatus Villigracilis vicinus TaxID=3140679 RepID=UPI0031359BA2|nr:polymer-forming cytoskeletal protein [Anaerolineales bacterium]
MKNTTLMRILLLLALLIVPTASAHAQTPNNDDVVLFGQNYTLSEGETLNGSLAVFGGNIEIQKDAEVNGSIALFGGNLSIEEGTAINGDIAVFGGNLTITGEVNGDIVIFGGQALLESTALIDGDIATFGGQVNQAPDAKVTGEITNNTPPNIDTPEVPDAPGAPTPPDAPAAPNINVDINPFWNIFGKLSRAVVIAVVAMLLALFLQPQLDRTANAIVRQPFIAGSYGLLIFIALPVALLIMIVTLILIPVAAIVALLVPLAWLFGIIALGQEVGERFAKAINRVWAPVISTGFGTFLLMLVIGFMELVPCVGWIPSAVVGLISVGAAVMTLFGTRNPPGILPGVEAEQIPPAA